MLETPHVAVGAAIAINVGNPFLALPIVLMSHFVLDKIPHWNPHLNTDLKKTGKISKKNTRIVVADSVLALILGTTIAFSAMPDLAMVTIVLLSCFVAVLPDLVEAPYYFLRKKGKAIERFIKWQKSIQSDTTPFWGLLTQGVIVLAALLWIVI